MDPTYDDQSATDGPARSSNIGLQDFLGVGAILSYFSWRFLADSYQVVLHGTPQIMGAPASWVEAGIAISVSIFSIIAVVNRPLGLNVRWGGPIGFVKRGGPLVWEWLIVFLFMFGTFGILSLISFFNGYSDDSQPQTHPSSIVDATVVHGRSKYGGSSSEYFLRVADWRPDGSPIRLKVDSKTYYQMRIGQPVTVSTKQGRFGYEWVAGLQ